eukprot:TRINITY_DN1716_c0_g2_i1.p1 TRINITY_DN1716_c0_g2~~TRINITY_DN1716_c0_g2_i1.p1  ORF type:complete len:254 (+),score=37.26 TRINITY_DN1716_c0_g2_i1:89-850(+)
MKANTISKLVKTKRQGGYICKMGERGSCMKFKLEMYATVSQFQPGTRVKYGPNPKRWDSKSFKRYAGYRKAKTVGEALKFGVKVADSMWELERGDYKVLAATRPDAQEIAAIDKASFEKVKSQLSNFSGPNGCPVKLSDPAAEDKSDVLPCGLHHSWHARALHFGHQLLLYSQFKVVQKFRSPSCCAIKQLKMRWRPGSVTRCLWEQLSRNLRFEDSLEKHAYQAEVAEALAALELRIFGFPFCSALKNRGYM